MGDNTPSVTILRAITYHTACRQPLWLWVQEPGVYSIDRRAPDGKEWPVRVVHISSARCQECRNIIGQDFQQEWFDNGNILVVPYV